MSGRLPTPPTTLIGRERECALAASLLRRADVRLLTLLGTGGVGKSRLALAVAEELAPRFDDGVHFIDLAPISDSSLLLSTIASGLQVSKTARAPLQDRLADYLDRRSLLLVLDNFEQILSAAPLLAPLLAAARGLKILVTSRSPLHLSAEHEFPVPPLELPDPRHRHDPEALSKCGSVSLFIQRARAVKPSFELTQATAPAVAELCTRLDGLPLSIELAAARTKLLSPPALLARLGDRLTLLTDGARDLPERQQTLRATIDWSHALLASAEQALFARLAVFVGGCSLQAAEAVCVSNDLVLDTLDGLAALVDKSLLRQTDDPEGEPRFTMLETVREYAIERLEASADAETVRARHADYVLGLAEVAAPELTGPTQSLWLMRLEREHDNLRAAIHWSFQHGEAELGLRIMAALGYFWALHGHFSEGRTLLERGLATWPQAPAPLRAKALTAAGHLAYIVNQLDQAVALHDQCLALWRQLGDELGIAIALHQLGRAEHYRERYHRAAELYQESLAIRRAHEDKHGIALTLNSLGVLARDEGDDQRGQDLFTESLGLFRAGGDTFGIALVLNNLARVARDRGDWPRVATLCSESLALFRELGTSTGLAWISSNLTVCMQRRGAWTRAAFLHGVTETLHEVLGSQGLSLSPSEIAVYAAAVAETRAQLGEAEFQAAILAGRAMDPAEALGCAVTESGAVASATGSTGGVGRAPASGNGELAPPLTKRESEVAALVARGLTDRQIADKLVITEGTVGVHLARIFTKLDLHSRAELAVWAAERGMLTADR